MRLGGALAALLLLLLAAGTGHGESRHTPPEPPVQTTADPNLSPLELLELGAPAVRYLRAFTTQCWQPDQSAPIAMFDNSWAVALVTIWNDLTVPSNGLGRLVTAMQLQEEGALMIQNKRPTDALSVLELSVLFTLYPVHHELRALAAWHHSLASNDTAFATRRASLARTLVLMSQAQAAVGAASSSVDAYEAAMISGRAAGELFAMGDPSADGGSAVPASAANGAAGSADSCGCAAHAACGGGCGQPTCGCGGSCGQPACGCGGGGTPAGQRMHPDASEPAAVAKKDLQALLAGVARSTAELLQRVELPELERLLDRRGLRCRWNCGRRSSLLKLLVPALRVPLRLVPGADGEEAAGVEAPPGLDSKLAQQMAQRRGPNSADVSRLGMLFAGVVATLQQPLLNDVNIKCSSAGGQPQLHRCRDQAERQFAAWAGGPAAAAPDMQALLAHVNQVEEALWRLDEVLESAMAGVRLGDGTTWVKSRGYTWVLGSYMAAKLYPQGQGAPVYYQTRRPTEPHAGSTICLDKTYLLDTVLRLDPDGLRGLQYALDNLHYAQFAAGGAEAFWRLLAKDNPLCAGAGCQTGQDPMSLLVAAEGGGQAAGSVLRTPRPMPLPDFRFLGEQQLQANLAAATDPTYSGRDPFVAAFVSLCVVSCASLYLYSHRGRLVRALTPTRGRAPAAPAASSAVLQRNAATTTLREALAGDSAQKLHAAIEAAEAVGVEKPLIKKARAALQALKRRRAQQGGGGGAATPAAHRQQATTARGSSAAAAAGGAGAALQPTGSGLSTSSLGSGSFGSGSMGSGSLPRSLSAHTAALYAAAAEGWLENASDSAAASPTDPAMQPQDVQTCGAGGSQGSSRAVSPIRTRSGKGRGQAVASNHSDHLTPTPPKTSRLASHSSSEPEPPTSPGTPVDVQPRGSPTEGPGRLLSSDNCTPLASPGAAPSAALAAAAEASAAASGSAAPPSPVALWSADASQPAGDISSAAEPAGTPSRSPSAASSVRGGAAGTPTGSAAAVLASPQGASTLSTEALSADAIPPEELAAAAALRQMTPRQLKKLLRLQQKRASGGPGSVTASEEAEAASAPSPARQGSAAGGSVASDDADAAAPQLTARELAALAAREESAPSKVPRSAKKKAKRAAERAAAAQAATQSGSEAGAERGGEGVWRDGRHGSGRHEYGQGGGRDVRRTLSDPQQAFGLPAGVLSPLRHAGYGRHQEGDMLDPRLCGMAGYPAPAYWQVPNGGASLNAHAPEFSPQPSPNRPSGPSSRLHSPGGYPGVAYGDGSSLRGSPFVGADPQAHLGAAAGHLGQPSLGIPYSPDGALAYSLGGSGPASLEPSAAAAAAAAQLAGGASGGQSQQASLLAQLQQIWGEGSGGGGGAAGGTPAFSASLGASPAAALLASEAAAAAQQQQQQQQQLAALLFMQQLEMQQAALAARGLTPGRGGVPDSPPLSPQQLPPASADMLRDVLGSPLSPLRWSGNHSARGGTGDLLTDPSLSLGAELAAAAAMALREIEETGEELSTAQRGRPAAARSLADGGSVAQQGGGQPQRQLVSPSPERPSFESMDLDALGFTESLD